jgi:hypothetical protein
MASPDGEIVWVSRPLPGAVHDHLQVHPVTGALARVEWPVGGDPVDGD